MKKAIMGIGFFAIGIFGMLALIFCGAPFAEELMISRSGARIWTLLFDNWGVKPLYTACAAAAVWGVVLSVWAALEETAALWIKRRRTGGGTEDSKPRS